MRTIRHIVGIVRKELAHIRRDNILLGIAIVSPILMTVLCGFIYIQQKVTQLPVVIFDQDQSEVSRMIIRGFSDSERLAITGTVNTYAEMERAIQSDQAVMAVVIPPRLQANLKNVRPTEVAIIINSSNILTMNTAMTAANQVVATIGAGVTMKVMQGLGLSQQRAYQAVTALSFRTRNWYNPTLSYLVFMLVGLAGTILQQVTFLGVSLAFIKEKEQGGWRHLAFSKLRAGELIWGKFITYFLIYFFDAVVMYWLCFGYFKAPLRGDPWLLLLTVALFVVVLVAMGMVFSLITKNMVQAVELSMLVAVPSFLVSGYTWPYLSMPAGVQFLSRILPLSYFVEAVRLISVMGAGWEIVWPYLATLTVFVLICLPAAVILVKRQLLPGHRSRRLASDTQ